MSYVLPLIIILVYLKGYYDMFSSREPAVFLFWMLVAVAVFTAGYQLLAKSRKACGTGKNRHKYILDICVIIKCRGLKSPAMIQEE